MRTKPGSSHPNRPNKASAVIRDRIRGFLRLPKQRLQKHPKNWRLHPKEQRELLRAVLQDVGIATAVLARPSNKRALAKLRALPKTDAAFAKWATSYAGDFLLVDGHLRLDEFPSTVPVLVLDIDEQEEAELLVTLDPIASLAKTDDKLLRALLPAVGSASDIVTKFLSGYIPGAESIDGSLDGEDGPEINPTEELRKKWGTERGQLWVIQSATVERGEHRLLCGDSTNPEDVARLMGDRKAVIMNTDAPYGVDYSKLKDGIPRPGFSDHQEQWGDIENDELVDGPALQAFLERMIRAVLPYMTATAAYYFWHHPMLTQGTFFAAAAAADILIHRQIIWKKPGFVLTRSGMYHWQHELCFFGWVRGHRPPWYGNKSQTSVWDIGRDDDSGMHPTQKPVELFVRPLNNHTRRAEVAYEPFSGSGSQLLACELLGRLCFAIDIAPKYVAVALERLSLRGLTPRLVS